MKKVLKILSIVVAVFVAAVLGVVIYYITWTPSTRGISEQARIAVERSEACTHPNNDFSHVIHFPKAWKKDYTGAVGIYPQTCMNTVSAFYSPEANWAQCIYFVNHLKKLGFKQTDNPKPGDMNHSNGGRKPHNYQKHFPIKLYLKASKNFIDYKYYTYVG